MPSTTDALKLPFNDAIDFFRQKVNVTSEKWTDVWREAHARGFTVAGATSDALLADFREAIDRAISQGTTLAEFRRDFDRIVTKHGWTYNGTPGWRSRVIYETNLSTAYSAGRYAQQRAVVDGFPYWQYRHGGSVHPRLQHLAWDGLVLRADDPFWATHYPPNGWRCSCYTVSMMESQLRRMGKSGPDQAPAIIYRDWRNPKTGELVRVPAGIDPGFDYNPGMAWQHKLNPPLRAPTLRATGAPDLVPLEEVTPAIMKEFLADPTGRMLEVGRLAGAQRHALGVKTDRVWLSAETMRKQKGETKGSPGHPEMTTDDYLLIHQVLATPDIVAQNRDRHLTLVKRFGANFLMLAVKGTDDGEELFLQSFRYSNAKDARVWTRRATLLRSGTEQTRRWGHPLTPHGAPTPFGAVLRLGD